MEVREVSAQNTTSDLAHEDCTRNATLAQNEQLPLNASCGLYRPEFEHDACGIGALAHLKGKRSHQMIDDALFL